MRLEYIDKYKYWEIDWWMICDPGWLDQDKVVMTHNRNVVDNLVPTKIEETLAKFSTKKKFHNLRHYSILDIRKEIFKISWYYNLRMLHKKSSLETYKPLNQMSIKDFLVQMNLNGSLYFWVN
jgi:hypothetical protein